MSPDLTDWIRTSLNSQNRNISPRIITDMIKASTHQNDKEEQIDAIWDNIDSEIRTKLNHKGYKIKRFRESIADLLNHYSSTDILRMDISCIKSGGGINKEALEHILFDE